MPHFLFLGQISNVARQSGVWWWVKGSSDQIFTAPLPLILGAFHLKCSSLPQFENLTFPLPSSLLKLFLPPPRFCPRRNRHHLTLIPIIHCCKNGHLSLTLTHAYARRYYWHRKTLIITGARMRIMHANTISCVEVANQSISMAYYVESS